MASKFRVHVYRPVRDAILYFLAKVMFVIYPVMPRKLVLWWHGVLASLAYKLGKSVRQRIIKHYTIAFGPEDQPGKYYTMGKEVFVNLAKTLTDYALMNRKREWKQFSKYFKVEGIENLDNAYKKGKGVLCMISHTPGWEFSAILPPLLGYPSLGVSSQIKNPALNKMMIEMRETRGMKNITRNKCYDILSDELRNGKCLIIMIDQDSKNIRGEFVPFFGRDAYTPIGLARLAMDTGAAVVPMNTIRNNEDDTYTFQILPEIPFIQFEDITETMIYNTTQYNKVTEDLLRKYPTQWVWMHERWKTTPESLNAFLERRRKRKALAQNK